MEESSKFLSVNKNKKGKEARKHLNKEKSNQQIINEQKSLIIILILLIIILFIIIFYLLFNQKSNTNSPNYSNLNQTKNNIINITQLIDTQKLFNNNFSEEKIIKKDNNDNPLPKRLFQYKVDFIPEGKKQIHISMAIDNKFIYPSLVSMASGLYNNFNEENVMVYHLLFSHDFDKKNLEIFDSLKKRYSFSLNYYIIPNFFKDFKRWMGGTDTVYYKLLLPLLFHDLDRIIYLDADTLIFKDLYEMYNLPFNGNYVLGYPFHDSNKIDDYVKHAVYYINGGVILFNNKLIRQDNKDLELIKFTMDNNRKLWFLEQDSINIVFYEKVGILPLKYGIYMYGNIHSFEKSIQIRIRFKLNRTEVIDALNDPSLVHFSGCNPKPWNSHSSNEFEVNEICKRYHDLFYFYANKTDYETKIREQYLK